MKKTTPPKKKSAYAAAGVDIDEMDRGLAKIKADVKAELAAELISIYEKEPTDPYTLYMNLPAEDSMFSATTI